MPYLKTTVLARNLQGRGKGPLLAQPLIENNNVLCIYYTIKINKYMHAKKRPDKYIVPEKTNRITYSNSIKFLVYKSTKMPINQFIQLNRTNHAAIT